MWRSIWALPDRSVVRAWAPCLALCLLPLGGLARASEPLILAVTLNGVDSNAIVTAHRLDDGSLAVAERDLRAWRLKLPTTEAARFDGLPYIRLDDLAELEYRLDLDSQVLELRAPARAFTAHAYAYGDGTALGLTPSSPGGFFNYDLNWQRQDGVGSGGGLFEAGLFNAWGSGTATVLWDADAGDWRRLDTTWHIDMPERMQSLRLGDVVGASGSWGRAVRFGGLQWATNFATRPGFITFPLPSLRGEAALPSTLDIYLDNARVLRGEVPAGPFDLTDVPVVTGQGELRMVVRDLLGRQQVVSQPYYASPRLLRPGLRDFAWEIGAVREDYGLASNRYGRLMLAATDRLGIRPDFTREWRVEILADQQTVGAGGTWLMPALGGFYPGALSFGAALSHGPDGYGHLLDLAGEHQSHGVSFNFQARYADRAFVQLGQSAGVAPRLTLSAGLGVTLAGNGLGLGYARQSTWQGDDRRLLSASFSRGLGRAGMIGLYALRDLSGEGGFTLSAIWTLALDAATSLNANLIDQDGGLRKTVQVQHNTPTGNGLGYRLLLGDDRRYQAAATVHAEHATYTAEAARLGGQTGYRAGVSGGVAIANGGVFPSRRIDGSFAVVKVGDFENVRVYRDNQEVARTNARGLALITQLRAYQANPVAIEQADLPMDSEVDNLELKLTPALRTGVVAEFPIRRGHQASFRLVDSAGQALPPGVLVQLEGEAREFPVGYDGHVFLTGLGPRTRLLAEWAGRRCRAELVLDPEAGPMPELGNLVCEGVSP